MRRQFLLTLLGCLIAATASADISGAWTANTGDSKEGQLFLNLTRGQRYSMGRNYRLSELTGLTTAQIDATTRTDVRFEMRREAGTVVLEGSFRNGRGAGQFDFTPNHGFVNTLRGMNLKLEDLDKDDSVEEQLFFLATQNVSTAYIRAMQAEGFRGNLETYAEMAMFGVTPEYIAEMRDLGYRNIDQEKIVELRIHGVTADYVRKTRAYGWKLSLDQLVETRIHGATPEFAEKMKKVGYPNLSQEKLVEMRIFGVTPVFVRQLAEAGYEGIPVDKLIEMKMHGIDAEFVKKMSKVKR